MRSRLANMDNIVPLPTEIWCEIFSHLDGKSRKSVAATCNHFLSILRGNEKTSGHFILKSITLKSLSEKIESEEWNWERWPCLKSLRIPLSNLKGGNPYKNQHFNSSTKTALAPLQLMKFERCPSLERILIFDCGLPMKMATCDESTYYGIAWKLCVNPISIQTNLSFELLAHLHLEKLENIDCHTLRQIGSNAKQLCKMFILVTPKSCMPELLDNGLIPMFKGLSGSLETVILKLDDCNSDYSIQALLNSLRENCLSITNCRLQSIHINTRTRQAGGFLDSWKLIVCN